MTWRHVVLVVVWTVLQAPATASSSAWLRERSCLTGVTPIAAHQRKNATVNGVNEPLRIGFAEKSRLLSWLAKILIEEVFGIHVERVPLRDSVNALRAVSGCKRPDASTTERAGCEIPGPAPAHIAVSVLQSVTEDSFLAWIKENRPAQYPTSLGDEGYARWGSFVVMERMVAAALRDDHLPLHFYLSYSHPRVNASTYFDSLDNIPTSMLAPCSSSVRNDTQSASLYLAATGDAAGLNARGDAFACAAGHWWLAPACRADVSRCIPAIMVNFEHAFLSSAQRATRWEMPLALAFPKDEESYAKLARVGRVLLFAVFPTASTIFAGLSYRWMQFPPHDPEEWAAGEMFSEHPRVSLGKWVFAGLLNRSNDGTARVVDFLRNVRFTAKQVESLMARLLSIGGAQAADEQLELFMCDWANKHAATWQSWVPKKKPPKGGKGGQSTACSDGQGLINATGGFVDDLASATSCAWCLPGRVSVQLRGAGISTNRCGECQQGRSQAAIGRVECELCTPGTEAPRVGMASCTRCGLAEYAMEAGMTLCTACPQGFVTLFEGAESAEACVCPAGKYRDGVRRDHCLECERGMVCPIGSDAFGLYPERRPQYPIAPGLEPGFWASAADPLSVFRCENAIRCRGGPPGEVCADGLEGQACQHCLQGFFWNGETCQECSTNLFAYALFPVLPCTVLPMIIIGLYKITGGTYEKWDSWRNCVMAMLFLVLQHYQVMQVIYRTDTSFTETASGTMRIFAWTRDLLSLVNLGCYGFRSFSSKLILHSIGPVFVFVAYLVVWVASRLVGRCYPSLKMEGNRTANCFFSMILAFFTGIADTTFTVFKCIRNPNGKYSLVSDRSILCYEEEWNWLLAIGIVSVLVWCGGMLLVCLYAITTAPSQFHRPGIQMRWKFLFIRYRADVHWWALVIVVKGIVVNLSCVVLSAGLGQVTWIIVTLLVYIHLTSYYRPWRGVLNNVVDIDTHLNLVLAAASMYLFPPQDNWSSNLLGESIVQVTNFVPPAACLPFAALIYILKGSSWAKAKKATDLALLTESVHLLAADDERLLAFLQGLAESDWLVMVAAKDLVQTELAERKSRRGYRGSVSSLSSLGSSGSIKSVQSEGAGSAVGGELSGASALVQAFERLPSAGDEVWADSAASPADVQDIGAPHVGAAGGADGPKDEPDDEDDTVFSV